MKTLSTLATIAAVAAVQNHNYLALGANVAEGETVTIGDDVFEFDDDDSVTEGNIAIDITGGVTPADVIPDLVAAINVNSSVVQAVAFGTAGILIWDTANRGTVATTETLAGGGNAWTAATTFGAVGSGETPNIPVVMSRAASAAEATATIMGFPFPSPPTAAAVQVRAAAGTAKAWDGKISIVGNVVVLNSDGSTDIAENDVVIVTATI